METTSQFPPQDDCFARLEWMLDYLEDYGSILSMDDLQETEWEIENLEAECERALENIPSAYA